MENANVHSKLVELFGDMPSSMTILEEQVDVNTQMEYFEYIKKHKSKKEKEAILKQRNELFEEDIPKEKKKILLAKLAGIDDVKAFRAIEKYAEIGDDELHDWTVLSLRYSRMLIESSLLDENQIFITTGLGAKGTKLRYFIALVSQDRKEFTEVQKKIIRSEFEFSLNKVHGELETIKYDGGLASIISLIPLEISVFSMLQDIVEECNQLGSFLQNNYIVTNVKVLSKQEVEDIFKNKKEL